MCIKCKVCVPLISLVQVNSNACMYICRSRRFGRSLKAELARLSHTYMMFPLLDHERNDAVRKTGGFGAQVILLNQADISCDQTNYKE